MVEVYSCPLRYIKDSTGVSRVVCLPKIPIIRMSAAGLLNIHMPKLQEETLLAQPAKRGLLW